MPYPQRAKITPPIDKLWEGLNAFETRLHYVNQIQDFKSSTDFLYNILALTVEAIKEDINGQDQEDQET